MARTSSAVFGFPPSRIRSWNAGNSSGLSGCCGKSMTRASLSNAPTEGQHTALPHEPHRASLRGRSRHRHRCSASRFCRRAARYQSGAHPPSAPIRAHQNLRNAALAGAGNRARFAPLRPAAPDHRSSLEHRGGWSCSTGIRYQPHPMPGSRGRRDHKDSAQSANRRHNAVRHRACQTRFGRTVILQVPLP